MAEHRYQVKHGVTTGPLPSYAYNVYDTERRLIQFASNSKSEVIARAQELNGFKPIDGDEQTYAQQTKENRP